MVEDVIILAIESSCDETAAAIVKNGRYILSNVISSQIDVHKRYGGVVPEIASRKHIEAIDYVIDQALADASIGLEDVDAIAVTYGPGLVGALLVGVAQAKALAFACNKPLVGVHHIEGHISANYIENLSLEPPFICLVVSGGHSHIVYVEDYDKFEIMGRTRDDAVGEAYDKVSRAIGFGYPGGPIVDGLAKEGNPNAINFPRVYLEEGTYDFSFSGLKSSVLNYINKCNMIGEPIVAKDVAASFQQAVVDVLVSKTIKAAKEKKINKIAMAGGVASNSSLRKAMTVACDNEGISLTYPSPILCTDNAAMIGAAGYYEYIKGVRDQLDLNAIPSLKLGQRK
jgi:N6-L-threonylcarbamoyladenine synthase